MTTAPITPYDGTSGWSGSDASEERAELRDSDCSTSALQDDVAMFVARRGTEGVTIAELREAFPDQHHGNLSGALSVLHRVGRIARLTEKRGRCHPYCGLEFVNGRETAPQGRKPKPDPNHPHLSPSEGAARGRLMDALDALPVWPEQSKVTVDTEALYRLLGAVDRLIGLD